MKKNFLIVFLIFSFLGFSQKSELVTKVVYKYIIKQPENPKNPDFYAKLTYELDQMRVNLVFNNTHGAYYFNEDPSKKNNQHYGLGTSFIARNFTYNFTNNTTTIFQKWLSNNYYYTENLNKIEWTLLPEKKIINNLDCFKAVSIINENKTNEFGKTYIKQPPIIAWYTPNIKCNAGPEGYNGLPGVVIELYNGYGTYIAESINFNQTIDANVLNGPKNYQQTTRQEFNKMTSEIMQIIKKQNNK